MISRWAGKEKKNPGFPWLSLRRIQLEKVEVRELRKTGRNVDAL